MFRKMMITSIATLGLLVPAVMPSTVDAGGIRVRVGFGSGYHGSYYRYPRRTIYRRPVIRHYHVMYRDCEFEPWRKYGTYYSHRLAHDIVDQLRYDGFQARVVHH